MIGLSFNKHIISMRERRLRRLGRSSYRPLKEEMYDPEHVPLFFQITVNVIEARQLVWSDPQSATSYVMAVLERKKNRTSVRKNQEEPVYREYLIFDMYMSIKDVQRSFLWVAVMEPKRCALPHLLGEANIDLGAVWASPNHQVYHKWVQLSLHQDTRKPRGSLGYLKVDISISPRGEIQVMPAIVNYDKFEDHNNYLTLGSEQQRANYVLTIYAGFNFPSDRRANGKGPSTYIRVSYCGIAGKTLVQHSNNNPQYHERISLVEMFPNMNQLIVFEVCAAESCFNRVIACVDLNLEHVSHDGDNGFLPTFGPSLLHMYGASTSLTSSNGSDDGAYYKGALLVSLRTIVPYEKEPLRSVNVNRIQPVEPDSFWSQEEFCIYCPVFEISMLDHRLVNKVAGLAITIGEIAGARECDDEFFQLSTEIRQRKLHYTGSLDIVTSEANNCVVFRDNYQVLQLTARLPDYRFRIYRNNIVRGIVANLENNVDDVQKRLQYYEYSHPSELIDCLNKAIDDTAGNILKFLDIVNYSSNSASSDDSMQKDNTELDQMQLAMQMDEIKKIYNKITTKDSDSSSNIFLAVGKHGTKDSLTGSRKAVKILLAGIKELAVSLKKIICKSPIGWPDLVIWLLNEGSRVAYKKVHLSEIIYSVIPEQCGLQCGKIQTFYMNPLKCQKHSFSASASCHCITSKVEVLLWVGLFRQRHVFRSSLPTGYQLKEEDMQMTVKASIIMVECRAFIYRAKLSEEPNCEHNTYNAFVRLNVLSASKDTQIKMKTSMPTWNQILKVKKILNISKERLRDDPPYALVEVYNEDTTNTDYQELLGRFQIQPVLEDRPDYAPKLKWYGIYKSSQKTGQILMSIQLLYISEKLIKTTHYENENTCATMIVNQVEIESEVLEPLPISLIPHSVSYKADIYWWGLRESNATKKPQVVLEIDQLVIKSDFISDKKYNSNFVNGKVTQIFESPLIDEYSPILCVRLYDSSTFGRKFFLGSNVIKHPSKFLIEWLHKHEREKALKSAEIMTAAFCEDNEQMIYENKYLNESPSTSSFKRQKRTWSLFMGKELKEEEMTLLPVFIKENNKIKVVSRVPNYLDKCDWWARFFQSEKNNIFEESTHHITIYNYELEYQPEFRKFKDWCSTLKLYNGNKTGIPERDQQLQCGFLKVGIVIYRWPPPKHVIAVSYNGTNLEKGYFHNFPENNASKYIVRVYIVKGINLHKNANGNCNPYVITDCGKRQLGDRNSHIKNTTQPIIGKMYELGCNLPEDYLLKISVYDYEPVPPDELVGTTTIDIEDRIYSKHRACVGLAPEYILTGPCKWRDSMKPSAILEELCSLNHMPAPTFPDSNSVIVNGIHYKDSKTGRKYEQDDVRKENICLTLLHKWQTLPICGHHLVPEHVETRTLVHPDRPGIERGKILLWVDIFPLDGTSFIPSPRDITPRTIEAYELRVIVWDVQTLLLAHQHNISWKTADLYVKVWIASADYAQLTDVHHNSLSGEGNFNWRMVFNFSYHHGERKIINKEVCPFTEYEELVPPILYVQVLDSKEDKKLCILSLNLNSMWRGSKLVKNCSVEAEANGRRINLFSARSIRAWWPLTTVDVLGEGIYAGAIDLELTLLPLDKATLMPVGIGRNPPSPLPKPIRKHEQGVKINGRKCCQRRKIIIGIMVAVLITVFLIFYFVLPFIQSFDFYIIY